ncbi:MAG: NAD(P)/FAD-dependent oxidoreductase [Variovorax sp.]|nr:NAD(P)/FAD-dependent oxidoreductase [Variovorax sp.]
MQQSYDLAVIGTGTAAMVAAARARKAGWSVAVVDHRPFGGTCALRGCDPKKLLIAGADAIDRAGRMRGKGVSGSVGVDWAELMAFKRSFTDPVPGQREARLAELGADGLQGRARFVGPNALEVQGVGTFGARHILIASGAEPVKLGIQGEEHLVDNEGFLSLGRLPRRIVMVGGGYVAAEFSNIAALASARVTILQNGDRMLKAFDPDLVNWLMASFRDHGIDVRLGAKVERVEKVADGFRVHATSGGKPIEVDADLVVHAAGRAPRFDELGLAAGGVEAERGRLKLNEFLQSVSNPAVYAAGDAARSGPPLTPVSSHDAGVAASNMIEGNHRRPDYRGVPSVAFTAPAIASVGVGEAEARKLGIDLQIKSELTPNWFTALQAAEKVYGYKTIVDKATGKILGAHLVGPHAEETINLFALAVRHGLTAKDLKETMFAYPTAASDVGYML